MPTPPRCLCKQPQVGIDDRDQGERPWSPDTADTPPPPPGPAQRTTPDGAPTVTVRYVVVDGPDGEALAQRQAAALRQALIWLATHDTDDHNEVKHQQRPGKGQRGKTRR